MSCVPELFGESRSAVAAVFQSVLYTYRRVGGEGGGREGGERGERGERGEGKRERGGGKEGRRDVEEVSE